MTPVFPVMAAFSSVSSDTSVYSVSSDASVYSVSNVHRYTTVFTVLPVTTVFKVFTAAYSVSSDTRIVFTIL